MAERATYSNGAYPNDSKKMWSSFSTSYLLLIGMYRCTSCPLSNVQVDETVSSCVSTMKAS